jgi:hypothetical protein
MERVLWRGVINTWPVRVVERQQSEPPFGRGEIISTYACVEYDGGPSEGQLFDAHEAAGHLARILLGDHSG